MTRHEEARRWERIGRAFEQAASTRNLTFWLRLGMFDTPEITYGLCAAMSSVGLPAYGERGAVDVPVHGPILHWGLLNRKAALHRATTAYLIAAMLRAGSPVPRCR